MTNLVRTVMLSFLFKFVVIILFLHLWQDMYTVDIVNLNKVISELNINSGCHVQHYFRRGCRDRDRMVVEITTIYAICAYHH